MNHSFKNSFIMAIIWSLLSYFVLPSVFMLTPFI